eukprot:7186402-Prymnesium_polylepis.1
MPGSSSPKRERRDERHQLWHQQHQPESSAAAPQVQAMHGHAARISRVGWRGAPGYRQQARWPAPARRAKRASAAEPAAPATRLHGVPRAGTAA